MHLEYRQWSDLSFPELAVVEVKRISIFFITSALIVGMVGCGQPEPEYTLMVAAGYYHTVGLKSDGTAVAVGNKYYGQCDVGDWTNITQVAAGGYHTVGIKSDGTVVAVGYNDDLQCNVDGWTDITQLAAGWGHTVGVKSDATVVALGNCGYGWCNIGGWTGITQVAAGGYHTVGIKSDSTMVAAGLEIELAKWDLIE